jgi:vacuolar protein sorting-associated protein 26
MNFLGFGPMPAIEVDFGGGERKHVTVKGDHANTTETVPLFSGTETIAGQVRVMAPPGKRIEHQGVKIELLGQIEMFYDRGSYYDFISLVRELDPAGELSSSKVYPFEFSRVDLLYESYNGINVRLRYLLRVTVTRTYAGSCCKDFKFWVRNLHDVPAINNSIKMEVGIEDCLHIEFEYQKSKYHLKDVVVGKIFFLLVRIKIKHMEIEIRRRESTGTGANMFNESDTIAKYEIMDGAPVRGESIPVRLMLSPYDLTPTYRNVANKFNVKYYLNLVLVDEEERRYFKQQEITLFRNTL